MEKIYQITESEKEYYQEIESKLKMKDEEFSKMVKGSFKTAWFLLGFFLGIVFIIMMGVLLEVATKA